MPFFLHHLKSTFEFITSAFLTSKSIKEEIQNAYKIDRLILDVLTPAIQDWIESYLIINSNNDVCEYLKLKDTSKIELYHEAIKSKQIIAGFLNLIKPQLDNNDRNIKDIQRYLDSNPSVNDLKAFDIISCSVIVKQFFTINTINGYFNEYSEINLRKKYNEADAINYSRLIRNKFYAHMNLFEISNQEFIELTNLIDKIIEKLNISDALLNIKQNILKHTITDLEQINILKEDIFKIRFVEINTPTIIQFNEIVKNEIDFFLAQNSGCLLLNTCCIDLSSLFVQQKLKNKKSLTFKLNVFISIQDRINDLLKQFDTLVIELLETQTRNIELIKHLKFESYKDDVSLILIGKDLKSLLSEISNCQIVYDHYTLNSLNDESRKYLLQKYVKFQSKEIMLKDLIGVKDDDIYSNEIINIFDSFETSMIAKLIDDEIFEIDPANNLKSNCDDIKNFYIDRTFKRYLLFEKRILNDEQLMKTNIIVDTQIKYQELIATNQTRNQIHLFEHSDQSGYLKWIRSSGCVSQVKKYLVKDDQYASTYKEDEFFNQDEKLMIITDEPGMGKTTFLKSLINKSEEKNHIYFIHICLNNFVNELFEYRRSKRANVKDYMSYLLDDFLKSLKLTKLQSNLFKLFSKTGKLIILFDGLDEVIDYKKDLVEIVSNLEKNYNLKKIIITTRTHLKKELEDELGVITYRLIKFDQENQIEFLKKYWLNEAREYYELTKETEIEIVNFAKILVEKFNQIVNNRINDFIGIPLQIRMLADMFRENVTNFIMEKKLELINELKSIIDLENIAQFYERFLESKFDDKYIFKDGNVIARDLDRYEEEKENYYDNHFEYSFQLIFKRCTRKPNSNEIERQKLMKRITKFGIIIQFNEHEPRFLHQSYAEFFIAKQIVSNKLNYQEFKPEIKKIFEKKDFLLIRKFIDNILMKSCDEIIINKSDISFDLIKIACVENLYFLLKYFIEKVDIDINEKGPEGMSLFLYACQFGHSEIIKLIIERKIDINENDNDGFNGLHHSSKNGHLEAVKILIQAGIDFNSKDSNEKNSIHYASKYGHKDIVEFLIKNCQIDINSKDKYGKNGLHFASEWGFIEIVKLFLDNGIEISSKDNKGMNSLHYSIMHGHKDIALLLISNQIDIKDIRNDGKSALHFAAEMGNVDIVKWLIDLGIDVKLKDNSGLNALHYSSEFGHKKIVQLLIEKGVDINEKDSFGKNAFDYALRYGRKEVMEYLIEKEIDLKKNNEFDLSALHFAAIQGQKEIVKILIITDWM